MKTIFLSSLTAVVLLGLVLWSSVRDFTDARKSVATFSTPDEANETDEADATAALMMCEVFSSQEDPSCPGFSDGMISVFVAGVVHPVTYDWEQDQYDGDSVLMNLSASSYTVTVTDADGCMTSNSFSLFDPAALNLTGCTNTTDASGAANADGAVTVNVSGGTPPYGLDLAGPSPSSLTNQSFGAKTFSNLLPGDYVLTLTDDNGCELLCNITIAFAGCALMVNGTGADPSCFGFSDGSIELTVTGATGTPSFSWSDGSIGNVEDPSGLGPGTYSVTVTDEAACEAMTTVVLNNPDPLNIICNENAPASDDVTPDGSATITPSGGNGPYTLSWSGAAGGSQGGVTGTTTINGLVHGDYTLTLTDANSCTETCLFTITSNSLPLQVECPDVADGDGDPSIYTYSTGALTCGVDLTIPTPVVIDGCTSHSTVAELFDSNDILVYSGTFGDIITQVEAGQYYYRYTITDSCGEMVSVDCPVQVLDTVDPVAVCDGVPIVIELDNTGTAVYLASQLDAGSTDNCQIASIEIRREILFDAQCDPVASTFSDWGPSVSFDACDLSNPNILLELMVTDTAGNTETCFTNDVTVVDLVNDCDRQNDSLALVNLYEETGGSTWNFSQTQYISGPSGFSPIPNAGQAWIFTEPMSTWHGVELSPEGCVQKLILNEVGMIDSLPDLQLPNLLEFYCYGNSLTASIPDFTGLTNLDVLSAWDNQLTDTIPDFTNLSTLTVLVVSENVLTGALPDFTNLPNLQYLVCTNNQLSGPIPDFTAIPNLLLLDGGNNVFSGPLPDFTNLPLLVSMQLYNNQLTGPIPDFTNLPDLTSVNLWENDLEGLFPDLSDNCPLLRRFYYDDNRFTFEDILPYLDPNQQLIAANATFTPDSLRYAPQDSVYVDTLIQVAVGDNLSVDLVFDDTVTTNIYYWYKDGVLWNTVNGQNSLDFTNIQLTDAGTYNVQVENPNAPLLTLYGRTITIEVSPCVHPDYLPLMALYNATDGPNWTFSGTNADPSSTTFGWGKDCDPCNWYGIECDGNNRVTCIDLDGNENCNSNWSSGGNGLSGTIPVEIGDLDALEFLSLARNNLVDTIPASIGNLTNLLELFLDNNDLSGHIPSSIGSLVNLTWLDLDDNQLAGEIPVEIGQLINIDRLSLSRNPLTGSIPPELGNLNQATQIAIVYTNISGSIPQEISSLTNIEFLNLGFNNLEGEIPIGIGDLQALRFLHINHNQLIGSIPEEIGDLSELRRLWLHGNNLAGEIPATLASVTNLYELLLHENQLTGTIPIGFGNLSNLNRFYLHDNNLEGCFDASLLPICSLGFSPNAGVNGYNLTNNPALPWQGDFEVFCNGEPQIGAPCDDGNVLTENDVIQADCSCAGTVVSNCVENDSLVLVDLYNATDGDNWYDNTNWLIPGQPISSWYGVITNEDGCVTCLDLDGFVDCTTTEDGFGNEMSGTIPESIGNLSMLEQLILSLNWNGLSGPIPASIGNLDQLIELDLHNNSNLSGSIPTELGNLSNLQRLHLGGNDLTGAIPVELSNLSNLTAIWLTANELSGPIPPEFGNLINLDTLNLTNNNLTGTIPPSLGNLVNLDQLIISVNQLTGSIPPELGNLTGLSELFLRSNQLTGSIPPELGNLTNLNRLFLYDNQLEGCFPDELNVFCSLGYASFPGTDGYNFDNNPLLPFQGDFEMVCAGEDQIGAPCDDGNPDTLNDEILADCNCGTPCTLALSPVTIAAVCGTPTGTVSIEVANGGGNYNYTWSTGVMTTLNTIDELLPGDYSVTVNDAACEETIAFTITNETNLSETVSETICASENYFIGTTPYNTSGNFTETITSVNGCDSTILLNLTVLPNAETFIVDVFCSGAADFIIVNGSVYDEDNPEGMEILANAAATGCDSLVNVDLEFLTSLSSNETIPLCEGEAFAYDGETYFAPDVIENTLTSLNGCDSLVTITLEAYPTYLIQLDSTICAGESVTVGGNTFTTTGSFDVPLQTAFLGCDSLIQLDLAVLEPVEATLATTLCAGDEVSINGELFNVGNTSSVQTLVSAAGCDSLLTVTVTFEPVLEGQLDTILCVGESVQIGDQTISSALLNELVLLPNGATNGCDSAVLANVAFYPLDESTLDITICEGEAYTFFGVSLTEEGQYPGTATNLQGCDSTVVLNLSVLSSDNMAINETICEGESYNFFGVALTEAGQYPGMGVNAFGCDSLVTLNLSVLPAEITTLDATICNGESYLFFGQELTEPGTYMETVMSSFACDSTVTLNLSFGVADTTYINASICEGESYFLCDELYTEAGIYECYLSAFGCDSLIILDLNIEPLAMLFAEQDAYAFTRSNEPVTLPVTENDVIESAFALEVVNSPQGGTLTIEENVVVFLSDGQYTGQDSFLYVLCPTVCPGICDTAMVYLNIEFDCLSEIISNAATAFSPNGDGLNDLFDPLASVSEAGECVNSDQVSFTIINRNGEIVLQTDSYLPWDGTDVRGAEVPDATYFYILEFEDEVVKRPVVVVR